MGATNFNGPLYSYGNMGGLLAGYGDATPDPNQDAGPSMFFQGEYLPDVRYPFMKDKVQGYTGVVPGQYSTPLMLSVDAIPAALGVAKIAAAAPVAAGVPMTLVAAQSAGITPNVPIRPSSIAGGVFALNGAPVQNVLALDFGFAFGNLTSGNKSVPVADSTQFAAGEPVVVMQGAASALLTTVASIVDATHITLSDAPTATNATAPIGTGNVWGPSPVGFPNPDAALPYVAGGPGLVLDPRQSIARAVAITAAASATGGAIVVTGFDVFGQSMAESITAVAATQVKGKKAFKYILAVTPQFTDAGHNYSVDTTDTYGFHVRSDRWELNDVFWAGLQVVGASTGYVAQDGTNPATRTTGDVRGTYATASASTGSISSLAMSGNRLLLFTSLLPWNLVNAEPGTPQTFYGQPQPQ
jgi:hypothetical protein